MLNFIQPNIFFLFLILFIFNFFRFKSFIYFCLCSSKVDKYIAPIRQLCRAVQHGSVKVCYCQPMVLVFTRGLICIVLGQYLIQLGSCQRHTLRLLWQQNHETVTQYCSVVSIGIPFTWGESNKFDQQLQLTRDLYIQP